jgi:hypothetical protein
MRFRAVLCLGLLVVLFLTAPTQAIGASIALKWTDTSSNETGFKIERMPAGGSFNLLATVGSNVQAYTDTTAVGGASYCYRVSAYNSAGTSAPSNSACAQAATSASSTTSGTSTGTSSGGTSGTTSGSSGTSSGSTGTTTGSSLSLSHIGKGSWTNYKFTLTMKSMDGDTIGVLFRFKDDLNYYRFSWDKQRSFRLLQKRVNGTFTTLAQDTVPYIQGRNYQVTIVAEGSKLQVLVDGQPVFSVNDSALNAGSVALYSRLNVGSSFDNIIVEDLKTAGILLWDDFNDGDFYGWTIFDETTSYGPSDWSVKDGVLVQNSNIGAVDAAKSGTIALY